MKSKLPKLIMISVSFLVGASVASLFAAYRSRKSNPQVINTTVSYRCPSANELMSTRRQLVVIAVPGDDEFYIGKRRVALSEIPNKVKELAGNETPDERVVFIKALENVKYETVTSIIQKIREGEVYRVELVPPFKKKVGRQ